MKSYMAKAADLDKREWWTVDLSKTDMPLGRLATRLAKVLMGKHKPTYTPHLDTGDFIVILNVDKVTVTGSKRENKEYERFTGYPSGARYDKFSDLIERDPGRILKLAVQRMLPKSKLGRNQIGKLKTYKGSEHPHKAQGPKLLDLSKI